MSENHKARRFRRVAAAVLLVAAASAVHADQMGSGDPSPTNDTEMGYCLPAELHLLPRQSGDRARADSAAAARMSPERIYAALTSGTMKAVGDTLTDVKRRQIAESMAGRPLGSAGAGDAGELPNRCADDPPLGDPSRSPGWNGWGADLSNGRYQPLSRPDWMRQRSAGSSSCGRSACPTRPLPTRSRR